MRKFKLFTILCAVVFTCLLPIQEVFSEEAYQTFTVDGNFNFVESQTGYSATQVINRIGETRLSSPSDMKFGPDGHLYIADTGNNRILISSKMGEYVGEFTHSELRHPIGIFPHDSGKIFVADDSANKVFIFTNEGKLIHTFDKPKSPSFGKKNTFQPTKVVVDSRENVYVLSRGNNNGIIMLNANTPGEFLGYFAPNTSQISLTTRFRRMIFSEEQLDKMVRTAPNSAENLGIDNRGLIYTVTATENEREPLKKLNVGGTNLLPPNFAYLPKSVAVGELDNIYILSEAGYIFEYTAEGDLLFMFAGTDDGFQRNGLLGKGVAIAVDEKNNLYTLDEKKNEIQVFQPTAFANQLHHALDLYQGGLYKQSKTIWQDILAMNSQFDLANVGLGYAYYEEGSYESSQSVFKKAQDIPGYSDAFWEVRNLWIKDHIITITSIIILLLILHTIMQFLNKKYQILRPLIKVKEKIEAISIIKQILFVFYFMKHPIDGSYGIKKEEKTSILSANILLFLTFVLYILERYFSGFIFKHVLEGRYQLGQDILVFIIIFGSVIICNYLIVTINDAEVNFSKMYQGFIYTLGPYLVIKPFVIIFSHFLTLNEAFLLEFANILIYSWIAILVIVMIKELNSYTVRTTIRIILLTLFTIFIASLTLFVLYSLASQVISFILSLYGEVVVRIANL